MEETDAVSLIAAIEREKAALEYRQLVLMAEVSDDVELALVLKVTERAVARRRELAATLVRLPRLSGLLRVGDIDVGRLAAVAGAGENVDDDGALAVDALLAPVAPGLNASVLVRRANKAVLQLDPHGAERRHERAVQHRRVEWRPGRDGMASLYAYLPAQHARRIYDQLTADAQTLTDPRTMDQRRADVFVDRMSGTGRRNVDVRITVSDRLILGLTEEPGYLDGYGPIAASTARELAAEGVWRKLLTDEVGNVTDIGKHRYRPPAAMAELVRSRDATCRLPRLHSSRPILRLGPCDPLRRGGNKGGEPPGPVSSPSSPEARKRLRGDLG